ncbi:MAG: RlmE family RNA methyltransferase [Deltaproteobacteria bacterium]|nr:RlmE family RNA methyltransferase [Deltaproteobacteria bacterium]
MKKVQDHYFHQAKKKGFAARSVFKLEEIDQRHRLIKKGFKVLDLGASPGSWMQYASLKAGETGLVFGVDLKELEIGLAPNMRFNQADLNDTVAAFLDAPVVFDLVLSDMAPKTTGIKDVDARRSYDLCNLALEVARTRLRTGGSLLTKVLQGGEFKELLTAFNKAYHSTLVIKPKSSRSESREVFVLGARKKDHQIQDKTDTDRIKDDNHTIGQKK